jgi:hypothetical protein
MLGFLVVLTVAAKGSNEFFITLVKSSLLTEKMLNCSKSDEIWNPAACATPIRPHAAVLFTAFTKVAVPCATVYSYAFFRSL